MKFHVKNSGGLTYLTIEILSREHDDEWLEALLDYNQNGFKSVIRFNLMLGELISFSNELSDFYSRLKGTAKFKNIEGNVELIFSTEGQGHIRIHGILRDHSYLVKTTFEINTDQTFLIEIINDCSQIIDKLRTT